MRLLLFTGIVIISHALGYDLKFVEKGWMVWMFIYALILDMAHLIKD